MEYTEKEIEFIKEAFKKTRIHFENELKIEKSEDVIKAIKLWKNKLHLGADGQAIAEVIFKKHGLMKNGKTTIEEHKRNLFERKIALEKQLNLLKGKEVVKLDKIIEEAQHQKTKLIDLPNTLKLEMNIEIEKIMKNIQVELEDLKQLKEKEIQRKIYEYNDKIAEEGKAILVRSQEKLQTLKNQKIELLQQQIQQESDLLNKKFALVLNANIRDNSVEKLQEELEKIEKELSPIKTPKKTQLNDYTVKELKKMADEKRIVYDTLIRKADLIKIIKGEV